MLLCGQVSEGLDVLMAINDAFVDDAGRPLQNIRIRHTIVLDDPFPDPLALTPHIPASSPPPCQAVGVCFCFVCCNVLLPMMVTQWLCAFLRRHESKAVVWFGYGAGGSFGR